MTDHNRGATRVYSTTPSIWLASIGITNTTSHALGKKKVNVSPDWQMSVALTELQKRLSVILS
jgi:hypothetical protein